MRAPGALGMWRSPAGYHLVMADADSPEQMQERLDDLGETIDAARRQAESDDLLPGPENEGDPLFAAFNPPDPDDVPDRAPEDEDDDELA
jgi:hypothetical protein